MLDPISQFVVDYLLDFLSHAILPILVTCFFVATITRFAIFYVFYVQLAFTKAFEKRVFDYFAVQQKTEIKSFSDITKHILSRTYHEYFVMRDQYKRRNLDNIASVTDRIFLLPNACKKLSEDLIKRIRKFHARDQDPQFGDIAKFSLEGNPFFEKMMGLIPVQRAHEFLNILPSLFIIGGIFGTFIGISKGLPDLGMMDLSDISSTKKTMDIFLLKISQAMIKSIIGIGLSVSMNFLNTIFSPDSMYFSVISKFAGTLDFIWNETIHAESEGSQTPTLSNDSENDSDPDFSFSSNVTKLPKVG